MKFFLYLLCALPLSVSAQPDLRQAVNTLNHVNQTRPPVVERCPALNFGCSRRYDNDAVTSRPYRFTLKDNFFSMELHEDIGVQEGLRKVLAKKTRLTDIQSTRLRKLTLNSSVPMDKLTCTSTGAYTGNCEGEIPDLSMGIEVNYFGARETGMYQTSSAPVKLKHIKITSAPIPGQNRIQVTSDLELIFEGELIKFTTRQIFNPSTNCSRN